MAAAQQDSQLFTDGAINGQTNGHGSQDPLEKDFERGNSNGYINGASTYHNDGMNAHGAALQRLRTAGSISIPPELFEKLYLSPQNIVKGDLRKTFGNPTPLALIGFLIALTPLSCDLMGWRGAGGSGAAGMGSYFFFGGLLMIVGGFLEFILGNTFPFVVFMSFGAFWLSFAATLQPFYYAYGLYAPAGSTEEAAGLTTVGFTASFGFFLIFIGLMCLVYLVCSLRTNVAFVVIFFTLVLGFACITGAYWNNALGIAASTIPSRAAYSASKLHTGSRCQVAAGACFFVTCMAGWYIFAAIMLASLDFPFQIPVGDLSTVFKGATDRKKAKDMV